MTAVLQWIHAQQWSVGELNNIDFIAWNHSNVVDIISKTVDMEPVVNNILEKNTYRSKFRCWGD
jgi:hypothetical protein